VFTARCATESLFKTDTFCLQRVNSIQLKLLWNSDGLKLVLYKFSSHRARRLEHMEIMPEEN
jgi:hypothetical protein